MSVWILKLERLMSVSYTHLHAITDGEFRRKFWHLDFMWGFEGVTHEKDGGGVQFNGEMAEMCIRDSGKETTTIRLINQTYFNVKTIKVTWNDGKEQTVNTLGSHDSIDFSSDAGRVYQMDEMCIRDSW